MLFIKSAVLAIAGFAAATSAAAVPEKRSVSAIRADFSQLNTVLEAHTRSVNAYNGGSDLGPILAAGTQVLDTVAKTTADVQANGAFGLIDSINILVDATNSAARVTNELNAFNNKVRNCNKSCHCQTLTNIPFLQVTLFRAAGVHTRVLQSLQKHKADEVTLYDNLIAKATRDTKSSFVGIQESLVQLYDIVINRLD